MANAGCANSTCTNATGGCFTCQPTCYSEQSFCTIGSQNALDYYSHNWPNKFNSEDIIYTVLHRDKVFNTAFDYINSALHKGSMRATSSWTGTKETRDLIYAEKVNEIIEGLSKFANGCSIKTCAKDDIIYASYFTEIAQALNSAKLSPSACDNCNSACNVTCKECQGCVTCEGCVSCMGHRTCHSPCHSPCHTPCHTPSGN